MNSRTIIELSSEELRQVALDAAREAIGASDRQRRGDLLTNVDYYTARQAARMIGVTPETFRRYVRELRITPKPGSETERFHIDHIERLRGQRENLGKKH